MFYLVRRLQLSAAGAPMYLRPWDIEHPDALPNERGWTRSIKVAAWYEGREGADFDANLTSGTVVPLVQVLKEEGYIK